jgi:NAD(P)-dependent dehydrogenase (short-subunit alcohol dehydrogenase family)
MAYRSASRNVVVTGAGRGLGRAIALGLLQANYRVLVVDQHAGSVEETCDLARLAGCGERVFGFVIDLTTENAPADVMVAADRLLGGVDVLVNNAGIGPDTLRKDYFSNPLPFDELSDASVRRFFAVNGIAPLLLTIHAVRRMRKTGWGRVVNVTTSNDSMMRPGFVPYGGTKASLEAHSAAMASELEGTGITVNVVVPGGAADTAMVPDELGFDRASLIRPDAMVPPILWFLSEGPDAPNNKRVLAALWTPGADTHKDPAVRPIGWPGVGSKAILPTMKGSA